MTGAKRDRIFQYSQSSIPSGEVASAPPFFSKPQSSGAIFLPSPSSTAHKSFTVSLSDQLSKLYNLKRDRGSGWEKPYKPALLLTLID